LALAVVAAFFGVNFGLGAAFFGSVFVDAAGLVPKPNSITDVSLPFMFAKAAVYLGVGWWPSGSQAASASSFHAEGPGSEERLGDPNPGAVAFIELGRDKVGMPMRFVDVAGLVPWMKMDVARSPTQAPAIRAAPTLKMCPLLHRLGTLLPKERDMS
jgi:hypothetical protein